MKGKLGFAMGGVHPHDSKAATAGLPIRPLAAPEILVVPLCQHLGAPASPVVDKGAQVQKGQVLAEAAGFVSARVHSPVSGKIKRILEVPTSSGDRSMAMEIVNDGKDEWVDSVELDAQDCDLGLEPEALLGLIRDAGVVGMGGAAFPTHVKLAPPPDAKVDTLLLNGAECEPYLTADHRLMLEYPRQIVKGIGVMKRILGVKRALLGIEDNKPDAIETMKREGGSELEVLPLKTRYPQGAEKQLIEAALGRKVAPGKLPFSRGVVVQNVGTAFGVFEAVAKKKPLIERVVTFSGAAFSMPGNFMLSTGTPLEAVFGELGFQEELCQALVSGGPMMGRTFRYKGIPVTKAMSGVLALSAQDYIPHSQSECIRCGRCVDACPMCLVPCDLAKYAEFSLFEDAPGVDNCVECGSCQYVCPSRRYLVQWMRLAKAQRRRMKK